MSFAESDMYDRIGHYGDWHLSDYLRRTETATINRARGKGEAIDALPMPPVARAILRATLYPTSQRDRVLTLAWIRRPKWTRELFHVPAPLVEPFAIALEMLLERDLVVVRQTKKGPALFANHFAVGKLVAK